jgi:hypothetical protein
MCQAVVPDDSLFCPECGERIAPAAQPPGDGKEEGRTQDRSFQKALYLVNGRMEKVLMGTSECDYNDPADERRAFQALKDESAACSALLRSFTVSSSLESLQRSSIASVDNYFMAGQYHLQHMDEVAAHGQTPLAASLFDQANDFFMKGIEFSSQESIHSETGEKYQDLAYSDACLWWVDSPGIAAIHPLKTAPPGDVLAVAKAAAALLASVDEFEGRIRPLLLSPVMDKARGLMLQAIGDYRLAAEWARKYAATGGTGELAPTYRDLYLQYLRLGDEHETAAYDVPSIA